MPASHPCSRIVFALFVYSGIARSLVAAEAIAPTAPVKLFNGKDLTGFVTWQKETGTSDPKKVFTVVDGSIRVSGEGFGYLATEQSYKDYHLSVEYKWGQRSDGSKYVRNSGVLLHAQTPDRIWPTCLEVQLAQGCEGDFIVIPGADADGKRRTATITCETRKATDGKTRWQPGGDKTVYSGKQFWWSNHEPGFKELLDTRGKDDVASPLGQWTRVECFCRGNRVTVKINGTTVNEAFDVSPASGRILLQNEANEVIFRNFELKPLDAK